MSIASQRIACDLGFAGTCFSWIFARRGRLSHEAYNVNKFLSKSKVPKMYFLRAPASQNGLKGKNTRLKHQSEQFWVAEKPTKGG